MNERIRELAEQATEYMQHGFTTQETYFDKEKFAELIVRECAESCTLQQDVDDMYFRLGVKR